MGGDGLAFVAAVVVAAGVAGFNLNQSHTEPKLQSLEQKVINLSKENEQLKTKNQEIEAMFRGALMSK